MFIVQWEWNGLHRSLYYTDYHADQFARALRLNGIPNVEVVRP